MIIPAEAEIMTYALLEEQIETEWQGEAICYLPTEPDASSNLIYRATIVMSQTQSGWQSSAVPSIGDSIQLSSMTPGPVATMTLRYPYDKPELSFSTDAFQVNSAEQLDGQSTDYEKIFDVLEEKLKDKEWMNRSCSIERRENGDETVYYIHLRARDLITNAMDAIDPYLDDQMKESLESEFQYVDNSTRKFEITVVDGKITRIMSTQLQADLSLRYQDGKLSAIHVSVDRNEVLEFLFSQVDQLKFDRDYVQGLLDQCEEWD